MCDADVVIGQLKTDLAQCDHDELGALTAQTAQSCNQLGIEGIEVLESITPRDPSQGGPSDVIESVTISAE